MPETSGRKSRLSTNDWLALAIDVVSREGGAELRIDTLCRKIGVTKGSFYAHFNNRADFVDQLVNYWADTFTQSVVTAIDKLEDRPPQERLLALMQLLHWEKMSAYDIAVRTWAANNVDVARGVEEVDRLRFGYIRQIFHDMGFRGPELDMRTRLFVVYHSVQSAMRLPPSELDAEEQIVLFHEFLTRP